MGPTKPRAKKFFDKARTITDGGRALLGQGRVKCAGCDRQIYVPFSAINKDGSSGTYCKKPACQEFAMKGLSLAKFLKDMDTKRDRDRRRKQKKAGPATVAKVDKYIESRRTKTESESYTFVKDNKQFQVTIENGKKVQRVKRID